MSGFSHPVFFLFPVALFFAGGAAGRFLCVRVGAIGRRFGRAVEIACGVSAAGAVYFYGFSFDALTVFVFLYALICATVFDLQTMTAPDFITLPFAAVVIALSIPAGNFIFSVTGAVCGAGALFTAAMAYKAVRGKEGMGMGDVKLMAGVGAFTGAEGALMTIFLASVIGAVGGFVYLKMTGKLLSRALPFVPFIAVSAICVFFATYGETNSNELQVFPPPLPFR